MRLDFFRYRILSYTFSFGLYCLVILVTYNLRAMGGMRTAFQATRGFYLAERGYMEDGISVQAYGRAFAPQKDGMIGIAFTNVFCLAVHLLAAAEQKIEKGR